MDLSGKVVIVTGAASGIGSAITRLFLEAGVAGLIAVDKDPSLEQVHAQSKQRFGDELQFVVGDVSRQETAEEYTRAALDRFGRIDVMINNAAISIVKSVVEHTPEEWDAVMNVNVKSIYWSARYAVPVMQRQGGGLILNTGSISGVVGLPTQGAYAPSKGAVIQMTRQMAIEFAKDGIRVNAICPGTVDTPIVHRSAEASGNRDAYWAMLRERHPLGRIASADEIARFYLYMSSDDATFFTGSILMIDGGFTAQ